MALPHRSAVRTPAADLGVEAAQVAAHTGRLKGLERQGEREDQQCCVERFCPVDGACGEIDDECAPIGLDHSRSAACLARPRHDVSS